MPSRIKPAGQPAGFRIGFGSDLHRLVSGRKLMVGGVRVPFEKGSVGHSDGDVLIHAICDALLGAAALGDIGRHFPDTAVQWRGKSSLVFLDRVRDLLDKAGYQIVNVDATVGLERPKLAPHAPLMIRRMARRLKISEARVSVKAKTGEGLGDVGRSDAIRAEAVALICALSRV